MHELALHFSDFAHSVTEDIGGDNFSKPVPHHRSHPRVLRVKAKIGQGRRQSNLERIDASFRNPNTPFLDASLQRRQAYST